MRLALGTVQFGLPYGIANQTGQVPRSVAKSMLQLAACSGIDTLDTAITYGDSEACLGEMSLDAFKLITKLPPLPVDCANISVWVQDQVSTSLARLGADKLYGLLLHLPKQLLASNGNLLFQALLGLKDSGLVNKVGISIYSPVELEAITRRYKLDLIQAPFNLVDRRLRTSGWMQRLKDENIEIHTRSAFLQGLLLMQRAAMPRKFSPWNALWNRWEKWLFEHDASAIQACLAFPLSFPEIDRVVVGADDLKQLAEIIEASAKTVPYEPPDLHCEDEALITPSLWTTL